MQLKFGTTIYLHRWSKDSQHEFTPKGQDDLKKWKEMLTLNVHDSITEGEALARLANTILSNYQSHGKVLRTSSKPRTETQPAEHLIVAALGTPTLLEVAFARVLLHEGVGLVVVASHRIYGKSVGNAMSTWLKANGEKTEKTLLAWGEIPSRESLSLLAKSKA